MKVMLPPFRRCTVWTYNLEAENLTATKDLPPAVYESPAPEIMWYGTMFYISYPGGGGQTEDMESLVRVRQTDAADLPSSDLPAPVREEFAKNIAERAIRAKTGSVARTTSDGRFSTEWRPYEGCGPLMITMTQSRKERAVTMGCADLSFLLDSKRDLLFYNESLITENEGRRFGSITEENLLTGRHRIFRVPVVEHSPQLFGSQSLLDGATRLAYTMEGDCDFEASGYSQPGQADNALGSTPNQYSVCFITIPPLQVKSAVARAQ
jgi:hypothetical protein